MRLHLYKDQKKKKKKENPKYFLGIHMQVRISNKNREMSEGWDTEELECPISEDCVDHNKLWKILKEMGIPDHLICSWKICMQVRKQQLELDMEQQTGSK